MADLDFDLFRKEVYFYTSVMRLVACWGTFGFCSDEGFVALRSFCLSCFCCCCLLKASAVTFFQMESSLMRLLSQGHLVK